MKKGGTTVHVEDWDFCRELDGGTRPKKYHILGHVASQKIPSNSKVSKETAAKHIAVSLFFHETSTWHHVVSSAADQRFQRECGFLGWPPSATKANEFIDCTQQLSKSLVILHANANAARCHRRKAEKERCGNSLLATSEYGDGEGYHDTSLLCHRAPEVKGRAAEVFRYSIVLVVAAPWT